MKKLVLSLLGAATLATASNAMALDTTVIYNVQIATRGLVPTFAGAIVFDFDSEAFGTVPLDPGGPVGGSPLILPGSCVYSAEWLSGGQIASPPLPPTAPLLLSAQCFVAEQMVHGATGCIPNAIRAVPTTVVGINDPSFAAGFGPCMGFNPFGQIDTVLNLQLGEVFPARALSGVVQFDSMIPNHTVYGVQLVGV